MSRKNDEKRRVRAGHIVLVLVSTFVALLFAEGVLRIRQKLKHGSASITVHNFETHEASGLRVPIARSVTGGIAINSLGFRGPELKDPKPPDSVRLAFLGGSVVFCAEASSNETTWPHRVTKLLAEQFPHVKFDYVNGGVPGYTSDHSLLNLEHRIRPLAPDIIVILHGTNDLSKDTRALAIGQGLVAERVDDHSFLGRWSLSWYLIEKNLQILHRRETARQGVGRLEFEPGELSRGFRERMARLVEASKEMARIVALATFSHKVRRQQSPSERLRASNTSLYYMPYMSVHGLLEGFEEYNRVISVLAIEKDTILIGDEYSIPGNDDYFADSVHLTDGGCELMAKRVVRSLVGSQFFHDFLSRWDAKVTGALADPGR